MFSILNLKRKTDQEGDWPARRDNQFENGNLLINNTRFVENSDRTETDYNQPVGNSPIATPSGTKLGEDEYFVMGDNRDVSYDSRSFGPIKRSSILGKAEAVLWPVDRISTLK